MKCYTCGTPLGAQFFESKLHAFCSAACMDIETGKHLALPSVYGPVPTKDTGQIDAKELLDIVNELSPKSMTGVLQPAVKDHDPVNYPSHYTSHPSGVECITITRHTTFNIGNAIKYLWRNGLKDGAPSVQDLKKAVWYINDEIKRIENEISRTAKP